MSVKMLKLPHTWQCRGFLVFFVITNLVAVVFFDPIKLVQLGSQLDGILLTPIQALAILVAFTVILPRLVPPDSLRQLRPNKLLVAALILAVGVFGTLCITVLPASIRSLLTS